MKQCKKRAAVLAAATVGSFLVVSAHAAITGFSTFAPVNTTATSSTSIGYSGSTFTLTDGGGGEATSGFSSTAQSISAFQAQFTYTVPGGPTASTQYSQADGFTFIVQNDPRGTAALGGGGGSKGYAASTTITNSAAIGYEMYGGTTFNAYTNGNSANPTSSTNVGFQIANGDPVQVTVSYIGTTLTTSFFDPVANKSYVATNNNINLQSLLGSSTGYIGFGGGTGGAASTQKISNFVFNNNNFVYKPMALASGYNQDMVVEASAPASGASANITATMDSGTAKTGATYYEVGYNTAAPTTGLPASGSTFTSQSDSNHTYTMGSYTANNAVLLTPTATSATITFANPSTYYALSFLTACGNGVAAMDVTINYSDGALPTVMPYDSVSPDWFFQGPPAWDAQGRAYPGTGATTYDNVNNNEPNLYEADLILPDTTDPISSVTLNYNAAAGNLAIFAVSGATSVPEPASMGILAVGTLALFGRRSRARK